MGAEPPKDDGKTYYDPAEEAKARAKETRYVCRNEFCHQEFDSLIEAMAHGIRTGHQTEPESAKEEKA